MTTPVKSKQQFASVTGSAAPLPVSGSVLLDVIRFGAAVAVALGHFCGPALSTHWPDLINLAVSAVAIFFVLSGFVIRLISIGRLMTATEYAIDRVSRIYSVLLPALLLTLAATLSLHLFPVILPFKIGFSAATLAAQSLACITFTGSLWNLDVPISFNSVFWSLCYECAYYAFYGIAFFGRGRWKWMLLAGLAILVGPPILFMLPLWLFGCLLCDVYHRMRGRKNPLTLYFAGLFSLGLLGAILRLAARACQHTTLAAAVRLFGSNFLAWTRSHNLHLLGRGSFHSYFIGISAGIIILGLLLATDHLLFSRNHASVRLVRRVADGTFILYLIHLPLFLLFAAYVPYDHGSTWQKISLLVATVAIAVALAGPTDALKRWMRKSLSSHGPHQAQTS